MISFIVPWNDSKDEYRSKSFDLIRSHVSSIPDSELIIGYDYEQSMNRSRARNNAFLQAKGEFLVILDADTWISKDALIEAVDLVKSKNTWVVPYQHYYNLTKEFTDKIFTFKNLSISISNGELVKLVILDKFIFKRRFKSVRTFYIIQRRK